MAKETNNEKQDFTMELTAQAFRQLNRLQLNAGRYLPGHSVGMRPSLRRRPSSEFKEHRMYVTGDDMRFVDWKASSRSEHVFVKLGEQPKEATVYILLDCSRSMGWGEPPKSNTALALAAAISYLALSQGDRLMIIPFSEQIIQPLGPISGKGQFPGMINYLKDIKCSGATNFSETVHTFKRTLALYGGLTFIISDLLDVDDLESALEIMPAPGWEVAVFQVLHPEELDPQARGNFEMEDCESGLIMNYDLNAEAVKTYKQRINDWQKQIDLVCVEQNALYTMIPTDWTLEREIISHIRDIQVVNPL